MSTVVREMGAGEPGFKIQLSNFRFIDRANKHWPGRKLRFTLTVVGDAVATAETDSFNMGISIDGCLFMRQITGVYHWTPPMTRLGANYSNYVWVSADLYKRVHAALVASEFATKLGNTFLDIQASKPVRNVDPSLPENIDVP